MTASLDLAAVVPAYDSRDTVGAAVASALDAGATDVVVVDDGSHDDTADVARRAGARVLRQDNAGAALARVAGIAAVDAPLVVLLDADDRLLAPGVRRSVAMLGADPDLAAAIGGVELVLPDGRTNAHPPSYLTVDVPRLLQRGVGPCPPGAAVIRTAALTETRSLTPVPLDPVEAEDYEMFVRLAMVGRIGVHDTVVLRYRAHTGKASRRPSVSIACREQVRAHYARHLGLSVDVLSLPEQAAATHLVRMRTALAHGRRVRAAGALARAVLTEPRFVLGKLR